MPHLSPMVWYFVSEVLLLGILSFSSVLWWSYNSSAKVKVNFESVSVLVLPWS